jgi:hypothetical protein
MALVIVPSLPVNVSVPVHCDVGWLPAAFVVGAKSISCATNATDRSKRIGNALVVFFIFSPSFLQSTQTMLVAADDADGGREDGSNSDCFVAYQFGSPRYRYIPSHSLARE